MRPVRPIAFAVAGLFAAGCGPKVAGLPPGIPGAPRTVAVLPLANDTVAIDAPRILQANLQRAAAARGYEVQSIAATDGPLREIGLTLGGQVPTASIAELKSALDVDAVLSGRILTYSGVITGLVNVRTAEAEVAMTDLRSGKVLWYRRDRVQRMDNMAGAAADSRTGAAGCLFFGAVGLLAGAAQHELRQESEMLAFSLCGAMPPPGPPENPPLGAVTLAELASAVDVTPAYEGLTAIGGSDATRARAIVPKDAVTADLPNVSSTP